MDLLQLSDLDSKATDTNNENRSSTIGDKVPFMAQQCSFKDLLGHSSSTSSSTNQATVFLKHLQRATTVGLSYENGPWLAGGAVRRSIMGDSDRSDFDLFFSNSDSYLDVYNRLMGVVEPYSFEAVSSTLDVDNIVLTYTPPDTEDSSGVPIKFKVQLIHKIFYPCVEELLDSFDFTICQFALVGNDMLYSGPYSLWDLGRKRLAVHKITYPLSSVRRMIKYSNQGFYVCNGAINALLRTTVENPELLDTRYEYVD